MEKFTYKMGVVTREAEVSKEMITYKNQNIPAALITGVGVAIMGSKNALMAKSIGVGVGGLVGGLIAGSIAGAMDAKKEQQEQPQIVKDLNLPPNSLGRIIVAYQADPTAKKKSIEIPVNTGVPACQNMIAAIKNAFPSKFVGIDNPAVIYKSLGVRNKELVMVAWIFGGLALFIILLILLAN